MHETGHVVACWASGRSIRGVRIGSGVGFGLGKLRVGLIPWGGGVTFESRGESVPNRLLLYGSGPVASAVFAVVLMLGSSLSYWSIAASILVVLQLAMSLLPTAGSDFANMRKRDEHEL